MKKFLVPFLFLMVALVAVASCSTDQQLTHKELRPNSDRSSQPTHNPASEYAVAGRIPAHYATTPGPRTLQPTLAPELFTGNTRLAYQAAKDIPQILAQLPCYCHCDRGHGHKSLHSCFESEHGENCGICIGEALMAHNLHKQGVSVSQIRKQIIGAYQGR